MDQTQKRGAIKKKLNEFTRQMTPGQMTKVGPDEVQHLYQVYLGRPATPDEIKQYENHPDATKLEKHLQMMRKDRPPVQQQPIVKPGGLPPDMGQGGFSGQGGPAAFGGSSVADPNSVGSYGIPNFHDALARGVSAMSNIINGIKAPIKNAGSALKQDFGNVVNTVKSSFTGFRTDRNNNPTAMTTDVARTAGLKQGVDYVQGDPFKGGDGRTYYTAKLLGNPIATTIKAIDNGGFYTQSGKPRWSYLSSIPGVQYWNKMNTAQKANIIALMYKREGGSGVLVGKGGAQGGQGGMSMPGMDRGHQVTNDLSRGPLPPELGNLGNITTLYGQTTKDEPFHGAIDVANANGTPIPEMKGGTVAEVGQHPSLGNYVKVKDNQGNTQQYSHLRRAFVQPGQKVNKSQIIAQMGDTGNSYSNTGGDASHLDYSVVDNSNRLVNPISYLNQNKY